MKVGMRCKARSALLGAAAFARHAGEATAGAALPHCMAPGLQAVAGRGRSSTLASANKHREAPAPGTELAASHMLADKRVRGETATCA